MASNPPAGSFSSSLITDLDNSQQVPVVPAGLRQMGVEQGLGGNGGTLDGFLVGSGSRGVITVVRRWRRQLSTDC